MSYKVLARKWRPQHFRDMIGQEPVLRALVNALDTDRLHHAYLFTGMRGVGKTTIARIFAKCLNCETNGVSASPCGECSACKDIEAGRFFDLIEVDAASRTKVEETRELLENVPYAPASGRYKVYLIDEVHMFSNHSFNALLKTLEEPPEHVKFLLATTDPQKVPVTVLSRCLQFNLKRMAPGVLADYLAKILVEESVEHERPALDLIARASEGSVRDALSLVEQAGAFGEGSIRESDVETMLGRASVDRLLALIESLGDGNITELFERVEQLAEYAPDFAELMGEILSLLHRVAMLQSVPESVTENTPGFDRLTALAGNLANDEVQLFYQIGLHARRDMPFAPDPREAFDMALLRMHAFRPQGQSSDAMALPAGADMSTGKAPAGSKDPVSLSPTAHAPNAAATPAGHVPVASASAPDTTPPAAQPPSLPVRGEVSAGGSLRAAALAAARGEPVPESAMAPLSALSSTSQVNVTSNVSEPAARNKEATSPPAPVKPAIDTAPSDIGASAGDSSETNVHSSADVNTVPDDQPTSPATNPPATIAPPSLIDKANIKPDDWHQIVTELDVSGMPRQLASHTELLSVAGSRVKLKLANGSEHLNKPQFLERLQSALGSWLGTEVTIDFELVDSELKTPAMIDEQRRTDELAAARSAIDTDPVVQQLIDRMDGAVDQTSVAPLGDSN